MNSAAQATRHGDNKSHRRDMQETPLTHKHIHTN